MFTELIPNGHAVRHPCSPSQMWHGVGHVTPQGGGARNPFGYSFNHQNKEWTRDLCKADSDYDGKTNGEELGDPDCIWTRGGRPSLPSRGHPGVCEPVNSNWCQYVNSYFKLIDVQSCPGIKN